MGVASNNEAEFGAISLALDLRVVQAALLSSASRGGRFAGLARKLQERILRAKCQIDILWTKGHSGGRGNDLADRLARVACTYRDMH